MDALSQQLIDAVILNRKSDVTTLLKAGADPNYCDPQEGFRPLHYAALYGANNVVEVLIRGGADTSAKDQQNRLTPIDVAQQHERDEIRQLISHGKPSETNDQDRKP